MSRTGGQSLTSDHAAPSSIPEHFVRVRFVVYKVALRQFFLPVLLFPLSVSFHQCSILCFIYVLVVQYKDKRAEPGNLPKSVGL